MALSTFAELKASVASFMHRTDMTAVIPDCISLAEAQMNGAADASPIAGLRVQQMVARDVATIDDEYVTLPSAGVLDIQVATLTDTTGGELEVCAPELLTLEKARNPTLTGRPVMCAIVGTSLRVFPDPDQDYEVELIYFKRIPALSDAATSNWVLAKHPNAYLYGALAHGERWARDFKAAEAFSDQFAQALNEIRASDPVRSNRRLRSNASLPQRHHFNINTGA